MSEQIFPVLATRLKTRATFVPIARPCNKPTSPRGSGDACRRLLGSAWNYSLQGWGTQRGSCYCARSVGSAKRMQGDRRYSWLTVTPQDDDDQFLAAQSYLLIPAEHDACRFKQKTEMIDIWCCCPAVSSTKLSCFSSAAFLWGGQHVTAPVVRSYAVQ